MTEPTAEDVRAAFPNFEIMLAGEGVWHARLTTSAWPQPLVTAATLTELVELLNDFIGGDPR